MRVLIVNTSENTGGAAVAANRLKDALNTNGVKAKMLVRDKVSDDITVVGLKESIRNRWNFLWDRFGIFRHLHFSKDHLWEIDTASCGTDITKLREFKEADVIHLAWINQGILSLKGIRQILRSGKPIVWTMHDFWPATGICHYPGECDHLQTHCSNCPLLPGDGSSHDLSYKIWNKKKDLYKDENIYFVACSNWLLKQVKASGLFLGQRMLSIPNPIDTHLYHPMDKAEARLRASLPEDKRLILFVSQKVTDARKGMNYFVKAVEQLVMAHPEMKENTGIALLGGHSEELAGSLPLPVYPLGYINDQRKIVCVYNSADVFVLPSLEDNLPNTIMEAMACGVPCVGFKVGGIPEMIDHQKTGYVAQPKDASDLARGIDWVLHEADAGQLSQSALHKVSVNYSKRVVALKYIEVYNEAIAFRKYKL